jgi:hypothetical protein
MSKPDNTRSTVARIYRLITSSAIVLTIAALLFYGWASLTGLDPHAEPLSRAGTVITLLANWCACGGGAIFFWRWVIDSD